MANMKVAQLERISQQLIFQMKTVDQLMAQTWLELELTQHMVKSLTQIYDEIRAEDRYFH